jgi:hypothetical protein
VNGKLVMFWGEYLHKTNICSQYIQANESGLLAHTPIKGSKKKKDDKKLSFM